MILSDLQARTLDRVGEDPNSPVFYTAADATAWLNAANRLFVLLTLCLESTGSLTIAANQAFYSVMGTFSDWLLPLRVRISGGAKLQPSRLADMAAANNAWSITQGPAERYALLGLDLLAIYKQQAATLSITYARCPATMANPGDSPESPAEFHPLLIDGAIPMMRAREGGQDWQKVMPMWNRFLDGAQQLGDYVRERNKEQGYDHLPVELRRFDRSKLLAKAVK